MSKKIPLEKKSIEYSYDKIQDCILLLENMIEDKKIFVNLPEEQRIALLTVAGKISRPNRDEIKRRNKEIKKSRYEITVKKERLARSMTGIRKAREKSVFSAPEQISDLNTKHKWTELKSSRNCYVCKAEYTKLHYYYDSMCPKCAELNYKKRFQRASLNGKVALITGSRVKIGYQATLMMLRAGATVIATTRFPIDSAVRYSNENDFSSWKNRLHIYGLDLRHTPSVELFAKHIEQNYNRLDILINNAAQTVRRPPGFYSHLIEKEQESISNLPKKLQIVVANYRNFIKKIESSKELSLKTDNFFAVAWNEQKFAIGLRAPAQLSQIPYSYDNNLSVEKVFPKGAIDADLQQVDLREVNSWRLKLGEIQTSEMIEIQLVNAIAPFVLCNKLSNMMKRDYTGQKHIVNVSAMEGKFFRFKTNGRHPHTNMAKAALNMLTNTSAQDFVKYGIYINAVDTGWVTDEDPANLSKIKEEVHDFQPPLDIVDGAARVCDPFFSGILTGKHWCGKFLKDYFPIDW